MNLRIADLFAGAGGFTEGFRQAGFQPVAAVEYDRWAARTYAANFGDHVLAVPIEQVQVDRKADGSTIWSTGESAGHQDRSNDAIAIVAPPIDVLIGGPPCQGFSPLGRMNDRNKVDPRNTLWKQYVEILAAVRPAVFVIENVPELLQTPEFTALHEMVTGERFGYQMTHAVLNAAHFGVPQTRRRAIIIGSRVGESTMPAQTQERRTVRDAFARLSLQPSGRDWHLPRNPRPSSIERYKCVPPGGNRFDLLRERPDLTPRCWREKPTGSSDVFGRMEWDKPAPTIRTEFFKPEKGRYLHPQAHRPITIREAARLQTFPDAFVFIGSPVQVAKQIGNAVPVQLALKIAEHVRDMMLFPSKRV